MSAAVVSSAWLKGQAYQDVTVLINDDVPVDKAGVYAQNLKVSTAAMEI
jgi:hypothetical protein